VSNNQSSTIVLPVPTDLLRPLLERADGEKRERPSRPASDAGGEPERLAPPREAPRDLPVPETEAVPESGSAP
jgi:hypothetical protein